MLASLFRRVNFLKSKNDPIIYFIRCLHVDVPKNKDDKPEAVSSGSSSSGGLFKRPIRGEPGEVSEFVVLNFTHMIFSHASEVKIKQQNRQILKIVYS